MQFELLSFDLSDQSSSSQFQIVDESELNQPTPTQQPTSTYNQLLSQKPIPLIQTTNHEHIDETNQLQNNQMQQFKNVAVVDQDTYVILDFPLNQIWINGQWQKMLIRKKEEFRMMRQLKATGKQIKCEIITLLERNSIIAIDAADITKRKQYLELVCDQSELNTSQNQIQNFVTLSCHLNQKELNNLKDNVLKISKNIHQIGQQKTDDGIRIRKYQTQIMKWIYDTLILYALSDSQVKYCKGLQYICLGIVVTYPQYNVEMYNNLFNHYISTLSFRQLFLEGSPQFCRQMNHFLNCLKANCNKLWKTIQMREGKFSNIFITYFRSCMIYRVTSTELIRKIFQLLLIQGIPGIPTLLFRILVKEEERITQQLNLLPFLSSQIINFYFQQPSNTNITESLRNLFFI